MIATSRPLVVLTLALLESLHLAVRSACIAGSERDLKESTLLFEKSRERFPDVYSTLHTSFMSQAGWVTESS